MSSYKYKFTIISAVYNVEPFVGETIDSIIDQSLGFKDIQLILVDDGSPDESGRICDEYAAKYPDNIFVIHKENGGVSSARNAGIEYIQGKYVNFIDSDDMWERDTLRIIWNFFETHYDEIDMVALPLVYFDAKTGNHILNYKFKEGSRVVDLKEDWQIIQMSATSGFFKAEAFKEVRFDTNLRYAEDAKVVQEIVMKKCALGLVSDTNYLYRARSVGQASAIQTSVQRSNWYLPVMENYYFEVIKLALDRFGSVPKYIQNSLLYDLQWRLKQAHFPEELELGEDDKKRYLEYIKKVLQYIDDDVIMKHRYMQGEHKILALKLKYSKEPDIVLAEDDDVYCAFSEDTSFGLANSKVRVEFITVEDDLLTIEGAVALYNLDFGNLDIYCCVNNKKVDTVISERTGSVFCLDNEVVKWHGFCAQIKLDGTKKVNNIQLGATINGKEIIFQRYLHGYFSPITRGYRFSHYVKDNWLLDTTKNSIAVTKARFFKCFMRELEFVLWQLKNNKNKSRSQVFLRLWYRVRKLFKKREIWLISDRPAVAGDNGEAFFRYMCAEHPEVNARFVIDKDCPDYQRMSKIGPVLKKDSLKHKMYVLLSDYILSSQGENEHFDPFGPSRNTFRDIMANKPFIFLQHGVTKDNLSSWLNKYNKNIYGFITVANGEYNSILEYDYHYTEKQVWLTGFPRFDRLYCDEQKVITIMPTWRKYLTKGMDEKTGEWSLVENFEQSDFFVFYNSLINDKRLLAKAREKGYKIKFLLHPNHRSAADMFDSNDVLELVCGNVSYTEIYAISDLVVTDFSSAVFDFAYLRKPMMYTHFDFEQFFSGAHSYTEGYFEYERDGFGEVEYDLESSVDRIIEYMENGCQLKEKYRDRIDSFFAFDDKNNSERVYKAVKESKK